MKQPGDKVNTRLVDPWGKALHHPSSEAANCTERQSMDLWALCKKIQNLNPNTKNKDHAGQTKIWIRVDKMMPPRKEGR